jgi:hypothetical protein
LGPEGGRPGRPTQAVNSIIISGIAPKQNTFKFKIAPHKQKSIVAKFCWQEDRPLANWALCLSTMVNPYNCNIPESGVKHHNPNHNPFSQQWNVVLLCNFSIIL